MSESENSQLATVAERPLSVPDMMRAVIDRGITADSVGVMERLVDLHQKMQATEAAKAFAAAFVELQREMPAIQATRPVPNNDGTLRYKFAPYEHIMEQVRPILQRHGFTVSFSMSFAEGRVIQNCTLTHVGGHSRTNQFMARVGKGPPGSTETQGDGAASTYAKRFALCDALNIVIERDSDARNVGEFISPEHVQYLEEQLTETGANREAFLKMAGVTKLEEIGTANYDMLVRALEMKKRR